MIPGTPKVTPRQYDNNWIQEVIATYDEDTQDSLLTQFHETIYICSDGGLKHNNGSYGIAVGNQDTIINSFGSNLEIIYNEYTSYRTEGAGMLQAMKFIYYIIQIRIQNNRWNRANLEFYCDNKSVVDMANKMKYRHPSLKQYYLNDSDLMIEIRHQYYLLKALTNDITISHVKGHQDRTNNSNLTKEALLNIEADR
jgi:ribonuclease HI